MLTRAPRSLRAEYDEYVQREIEDYKYSLTNGALFSLADDAARTLHESDQVMMGELLLADEVDRIIRKRLRIPSYETWRKRRLRNASAMQKPEHWGLRPDTPLARAIPAVRSALPVLVSGARVEGTALYLAANGCEITAFEPEQEVADRLLDSAREAGLGARVRTEVSDLMRWEPDGPIAAVVCTPAAFQGLSTEERRRVIELLQAATADGGVHLVETIVAGQMVMDEEELRSRYDGWQIQIVREPGETQAFLARKAVA